MSVPVYKRGDSPTQYINLLYDLNIRIGQTVSNGPKKYLNSYGDRLIRMSLQALNFAQTANRIYISKRTPDEDFTLRRRFLHSLRGAVDNISTTACIYLELSLKEKANAKEIRRRQEDIGNLCGEIIDKVTGVMKHDQKIYNNKHKSNTTE